MPRRGENIYKRKDGRYEGRYVIGRREDGRTRFGYVYGKRYSTVRSLLMQKKASLCGNCGREPAHGQTLGQWMRRWLDGEVRLRVKESSYHTYRRHMEKHVMPLLGWMSLTSLTADDVRDAMEALHSKGLAHSTVRAVLRLISSAMQAAVEAELIRRNPCRSVKLKQAPPAEQRALTCDEQRRVTAALYGDGKNLPALLGLYTGMRLGEICALKWQDVDWQRGAITVRRTAQRVAHADCGSKTRLMIGTPKTQHSKRVITVPDFVLHRLRALQQHSRGEYIFGSVTAAEPRTVQRRFASAMKRLGIQGVHFHTLRHTFATRLMELGVDVKTVSVLLGHGSAKITLDLYAHSLMQQQREAIVKLGRAYG